MIATPSQQAADDLAAEEKAIVASRVEMLGPDGLAAKEAEQEAAQEANEQEIPEELIANVPIPAVDRVSLHLVGSGVVSSTGEIKMTVMEETAMDVEEGDDDDGDNKNGDNKNDNHRQEKEEVERVVGKQLEEIQKAGCPYEVAIVHLQTAFTTVACLFTTQVLSTEEKRYVESIIFVL